MDPHFHDISIALHRESHGGGPAWRLNTYATRAGAVERLQQIAVAMVEMAAMEAQAGDPLLLAFPCKSDHQLAVRRAFIETVKLDLSQGIQARPLSTFDKKSDASITVRAVGSGAYRITADKDTPLAKRRAATVAGGLVRLAGMSQVQGDAGDVCWDCGHEHETLVGLLLIRALNARGVLREQEMAASRGILSAPSAQK